MGWESFKTEYFYKEDKTKHSDSFQSEEHRKAFIDLNGIVSTSFYQPAMYFQLIVNALVLSQTAKARTGGPYRLCSVLLGHKDP